MRRPEDSTGHDVRSRRVRPELEIRDDPELPAAARRGTRSASGRVSPRRAVSSSLAAAVQDICRHSASHLQAWAQTMHNRSGVRSARPPRLGTPSSARRPPTHRSGAVVVCVTPPSRDLSWPRPPRDHDDPPLGTPPRRSETTPGRAGLHAGRGRHLAAVSAGRPTMCSVLRRGHDLTPMSWSAGVRRHAPGRRRSVGPVKTAADPPAGRRPAHANDENSTTRQTGTTQ